MAENVGDDVVVGGWGGGFHKVVGVIKPALLFLGRVCDVSDCTIVIAMSVLVDRLVCPGPLVLAPPVSPITAHAANEDCHNDNQKCHTPCSTGDDVIVEGGAVWGLGGESGMEGVDAAVAGRVSNRIHCRGTGRETNTVNNPISNLNPSQWHVE